MPSSLTRRFLKCIAIEPVILTFFLSVPPCGHAIGAYDGVWVGEEIITVPGYGSESVTTFSILYQKNATTIQLWDEIINPVDLIYTDSAWRLPAPIYTTYDGYSVRIDSVVVNFQSTTHLTGLITMTVLDFGITATGEISHYKWSCTTLANNETITGLSGQEDGAQCFQIDLPAGASDLTVKTWGGTGDSDLVVAYHRPDFCYTVSESSGNKEQIDINNPQSGRWYIGIYGFESFSGLNLNTQYAEIPGPETISISGDTIFDLTDVVLGLQVLAGQEPSLPVSMDADINGDSRIGPEEVIYALQKASE